MRCPKCRTLTLLSAMEARETGSLVRCPRCPAVWLARNEGKRVAEVAMPPPMTQRGPLIIEGEILSGGGAVRDPHPTAVVRPRFEFRRYGIAAGAAALMLALAAVVLLAPDVSALPGLALLDGAR